MNFSCLFKKGVVISKWKRMGFISRFYTREMVMVDG